MNAKQISEIAEQILSGFSAHRAEFRRITARAKNRFEKRDWPGRHKDALERLDLYGKSLTKSVGALSRLMGKQLSDRTIWIRIKGVYAGLIEDRDDRELAETFYNSVTKKILKPYGIDREVEFFYLEAPPSAIHEHEGIFKRYTNSKDTRLIVQDIFEDHRFAVDYEDIERDSAHVAREIDLQVWPYCRYEKDFAIDIINAMFYRNKVAYMVGRLVIDNDFIPLVIPLYNGQLGIFADTVLMSEADVSTVFSFAFSYFHVEITCHQDLIAFLVTILPRKPITDLYTSIGYNNHGKTEFYRCLHRFVHESREKYVIAPGKEGAIIIGFTLPDFNYVFKVIKDRPCFLRSDSIPPKMVTKDDVIRQYNFIRHRDRVGRMVDTQEFENLRFRKKRFSKELLNEFFHAAKENVRLEGEHVIINHLYVQRKVVPLPLFLLSEKDPEMIRKVILDFGYFFKDLAATGLFPSDLFNTWNYGVTQRARVVLFDYDDIQPLERINFRVKPQPLDEMSILEPEENWITASPVDFFIDELDRYSGLPGPLKGIFKVVHADLYTIEFWSEIKKRLKRGDIVDITPYDRSKRFLARLDAEIFI